MHLSEGLLLVFFVGEAHKSVAAGHAADGVRHDLGGLGGGVLVLEKLYENELSDLRAKVTDKNGVLGTTLVAAVRKLAFFGQAQC